MKYYLTLFLCVLFLPVFACAAVRINEVAWMGTAASQYAEWIELYNDGTEAMSLAGWKIYKTGDTLLFTLSKVIAANGYLLIERTTSSVPDAVPNIHDEAGPFGGSGLRNTGEDLTLKDKDGNAVNVLPFASGWPAGDAKTKDTMQWTGAKWITAPGTPDTLNAVEDTATTASASNDANTPITQTAAVVAPVIFVSAQPAPVPSQTDPSSSITPVPVTPIVTTPIVISQTSVAPAPIVSAQPPAPAPVSSVQPVAKVISSSKSSTKTVSKSTPAIAATDASNEKDADTLENSGQPASDESTATKQENNHTKIIIIGAVILFILALFLLLERFKAQEE